MLIELMVTFMECYVVVVSRQLRQTGFHSGLPFHASR